VGVGFPYRPRSLRYEGVSWAMENSMSFAERGDEIKMIVRLNRAVEITATYTRDVRDRPNSLLPASSPHFRPLERCLPANMKPVARPPPPPFSYLGSTRRKASTCHARWRSCCSLVCSDLPRNDQRADPGFTEVITVFARRKSKSTGNDVLFVGASDAGKTVILSSVSRRLTTRRARDS